MKNQPAHLIFQISRGILRDQAMRRRFLFGIMLAALALVGLGVAGLDAWLAGHPLVFLLYWGACFWLTFSAILLALYDMLLIRREASEERRRLRSKYLGEDGEPKP